MSEQGEDIPKLQIDSDWKAAAQEEKERLRAKEEKDKVEKSEQPPQGLPEASFTTLIDVLASQALSGLGVFADKTSGGIMIDLPIAKFNIDLLQVVADKTEGSLTDEEKQHVDRVLPELRSRFVQIVQMMAEQEAQGTTGAGPGNDPKEPGTTSGIVTP